MVYLIGASSLEASLLIKYYESVARVRHVNPSAIFEVDSASALRY
jgi:hypothetical protein